MKIENLARKAIGVCFLFVSFSRASGYAVGGGNIFILYFFMGLFILGFFMFGKPNMAIWYFAIFFSIVGIALISYEIIGEWFSPYWSNHSTASRADIVMPYIYLLCLLIAPLVYLVVPKVKKQFKGDIEI